MTASLIPMPNLSYENRAWLGFWAAIALAALFLIGAFALDIKQGNNLAPKKNKAEFRSPAKP